MASLSVSLRIILLIRSALYREQNGHSLYIKGEFGPNLSAQSAVLRHVAH